MKPRYIETVCPKCRGSFDWELNRCTITDPPYAGSVQYAEMSDFFYGLVMGLSKK